MERTDTRFRRHEAYEAYEGEKGNPTNLGHNCSLCIDVLGRVSNARALGL